MRWFVLMAALLLQSPGPALACPPLDACVVRLPSTIDEPSVDEVLETPAPQVAPKLAPGEIEMPWIWRVLAQRVHSQLPQYNKRDHSLTIVLSPVVVTSPSDTVPGVGISGDF